MRKWVVLGALVGFVAGLAAALFFWAIDVAAGFFMGTLVGFTPPSPLGEGGEPISEPDRWWLLPLVVGLGALISGLLVYRFAPEAEGAGQDAAIDALHHRARSIRARVPLVKTIASAITIGSGGSAGREGPMAQIGAGLGSILARLFDLDARDARILVASGMGAGVGAIFRAPLGGAVLAAEIPYRDDTEAEALVPSFVASMVAFAVFGSIIGVSPIFGQIQATFEDPLELVWYALIGVAAGLLGRLYIGSFYWFEGRFRKWSLPRWAKPAMAGLAVGALGMLLPGVLGTGYGWIHAMLSRESLMALPLLTILVLPFAKILATSLSIGSGGSGGVFGPGMFIGALLGAGLWRLLEPVAPYIPVEPAGFVVVAMVALFGSIAHAPLAVMLMVAEMTGNLAMLAPAMLGVGLATLVVGDRTMFRSQLRTQADSPAHRFRMALPLMASVPARDAATSPRLALTADRPIEDALAQMAEASVHGAPVVGTDGSVLGSLDLAAADPGAGSTVGDQMLDPVTIPASDSLDGALGALVDNERDWAPMEEDGRLIGVLSTRDIMAAYRRALASNVRRVGSAGTSGGSIVEADVGPDSALVGVSIAEAPFPREAVVVAIERDDEAVVPRGDVVFQAGDRLSVFVMREGKEPLLDLLAERTEHAEQTAPLPADDSVGRASPPRAGSGS